MPADSPDTMTTPLAEVYQNQRDRIGSSTARTADALSEPAHRVL